MQTLTIVHHGSTSHIECTCVCERGIWLTENCNPLCHDHSEGYLKGKVKPNYPVPSTIGYQTTKYGTYLFDTRYPIDGMPLFSGYVYDWSLDAPFAYRRGWSWGYPK